MRRTAYVNRGKDTDCNKITCELIGEMSDHTKVWEDIETGEQYLLCYTNVYGFRLYYFTEL